ncbi:hypothetical protein [Sinanaerobacter sp. ZZT-01]|uniref:hypothetical protein n=1 Tax=Sinanaerobacter sp. ZZT-01 TaxID=3111540 RepID=UPI002D793D04|nr:hypothetical protein [Sinanaerobacter sp. ZZT-01]WRR92800.1 hypothetical protein U5921_12270 [Sinanaerobacter sp. ZZT-01]
MFKNKKKKEWRDGVYLTTAKNSLEADILESKLRGEGIPTGKKYKGASNALEIIMGNSISFPIDLYVPKECLEDAKNIIIPIMLTDEEFEKEWNEDK